MMLPLLAHVRVQRTIGRPPTPARPGAGRQGLLLAREPRSPQDRGIGSVIPEPDDQNAHRRRIGSSRGRPVTYDRTAYRGRNVIERAFNGFSHWRGLAPPSSTAAASSSQPCCSGSPT
jgi:hypothetical protein